MKLLGTVWDFSYQIWVMLMAIWQHALTIVNVYYVIVYYVVFDRKFRDRRKRKDHCEIGTRVHAFAVG